MNTVILGSGLPALCAAHALSNLGHLVTVLEPFGVDLTWDADAPIFFAAAEGANELALKRGASRFHRSAESVRHASWLVNRWVSRHFFPQGWQSARMESLMRRSHSDRLAMQQQLGLPGANSAYAGLMSIKLGGACSMSSVPALLDVADSKLHLRGSLIQRGVRFAVGVATGTVTQSRQLQMLTVRVNGGRPEAWPTRWLVVTDWSQAEGLLVREGVKPTLARLSRLGMRLTSAWSQGARSPWCVSDKRSGLRAIRSGGAGWVYGPSWLGAVPNIDPEMALPLAEFARQVLGGHWVATSHRPKLSSTWVSPTGLPLVEPTALSNVYLNLGHSDANVGSTFGAATWLAEDIERVGSKRRHDAVDLGRWHTSRNPAC
jgi:hypothetical protein